MQYQHLNNLLCQRLRLLFSLSYEFGEGMCQLGHKLLFFVSYEFGEGMCPLGNRH